MQMLSSLSQEQLYQFISTACHDEGLIIIRHPVRSLLLQLLQCVHSHLGRKFMLEKLSVHQLSTCLSFDQHQSFDDIIVGKETKGRGFFTDAPNYHALVVRPTHYGLPILRNRQSTHPVLMTRPRALAVASIDFPQFDSLVSRAREDHVALGIEEDVADVMIMTEESLEAEVVVIEIPELDGEI